MLVLIDDVLNVKKLPLHEHFKGVRLLLIEVIGLVVALVPNGRISTVVDGCEAILDRGRNFLDPAESDLPGVLPDL